MDEISEPSEPSSIVLEYMDSDLLTESNQDRLSRPEIKRVARATLEVLKVLHADGLVHTGMDSFLAPALPPILGLNLRRRETRQYFCQLWREWASFLRGQAW